MKQISVQIVQDLYPNSRSSMVVSSLASKFKSQVRIAYKGRSTNMASIMGVISLGIMPQSEVVISCEGEDEESAIVAIEEILRQAGIIA